MDWNEIFKIFISVMSTITATGIIAGVAGIFSINKKVNELCAEFGTFKQWKEDFQQHCIDTHTEISRRLAKGGL